MIKNGKAREGLIVVAGRKIDNQIAMYCAESASETARVCGAGRVLTERCATSRSLASTCCPGADEKFGDFSRDRRVDVGLHLHRLEREQLCAALDCLIRLHGDAGNDGGGRRADLARIGRIGFGMRALNARAGNDRGR